MKNIDRFGVSIEQMQSLVQTATKSGADFCELYFEDSVFNDYLLRDGSVSSAGYHVDYGCGIRALKGERTGYAYAESTDIASLTRAAKAAASIAESSSAQGSSVCVGKAASTKAGTKAGSKASSESFYKCQTDWHDCQSSLFAPFLKRIEEGIRARESRTLKVIAMLSWSQSEVLIYNSLGEILSDSRPLCSITVSSIFESNGRNESSYSSKSLRTGAEMLSESLLEELVSKAVEGLDAKFEARRPKGGQMSVVLGAGASGILLHEAMGHAFEADFNRKSQSVFSDKMGQQICRKGINIVDDGTLPALRGSINIDDEGIPGQKTYMVADGRLNSYLHDRISASYYSVEPTGNGRRESFRYNPIPRMRSTYMESGSDGSKQDLIASVSKGIYVDQFANGEVKIGEGDFTFYVKSGFLIEGGRLTAPIKDINIIGNGPEALADIEAVASDLIIDEGTWTCGKEQSVAVSCGMPSVLIRKLTVGGE